MKCSKCGREAVIFIRYNGRYLCEEHFSEFVERRVKREVRKQRFPKGTIAVALSGGKDSIVACHLLKEITREGDSRTVHAITVDEGIKGYREETIKIAEAFCAEHDIPHHIISFRDTFGFTLDEVSRARGELAECTYCGVFRRYCLNMVATEIGAKAIAMGHNLDDMSQTILMNFVRGDVERMARMAPHKKVQPGFIPRLVPLRTIPEKEATLYAYLKGFQISEHECPYAVRALRGIYRDFITSLEEHHPGSRHSILKSFLELEDCLRRQYPPAQLHPCERCGQPTSETLCMVCRLREAIETKV
ncbi:MAG: TIGR00269 family protein [Thermoplasmata archaeon]|nr:MAG: TIGR00269 family protein [Thermoplasmata archaeon]